MELFSYIIIGGGMAADSAVRGIRERDSTGRIALFSKESHLPYDRPPLSKGLWMGKAEDTIWRKTEDQNIVAKVGTEITRIDPENRIVYDTEGTSYQYEKLLLATGGTPKRLTCPDPDVIYFRTLQDYYALRALYDQKEEFTVIGSGYIGTEIACALAMNGKKVKMIFREPSIGSKKFPANFSRFLNAYFTENGVKLYPNENVVSIKKTEKKYLVTCSGGSEFETEGIIAGIGITPNTELAASLDLPVDNGIVVDAFLRTPQQEIYAAGDAANFYNPLLDKRMRMEHEDAANAMGKQAGRNMAGAEEPFTYLPYFYSDLFEIGYEAIGEVDAEMETVEEWIDIFRKGAIYYLKDGKMRGAIFCGIWDQIEMARSLISSKETFTPEKLYGLITI